MITIPDTLEKTLQLQSAWFNKSFDNSNLPGGISDDYKCTECGRYYSLGKMARTCETIHAAILEKSNT